MNRSVTRKSVVEFLEYMKNHYKTYYKYNNRYKKDIEMALRKFEVEDL